MKLFLSSFIDELSQDHLNSETQNDFYVFFFLVSMKYLFKYFLNTI